MIFITFGTQKFAMNRVVTEIDNLIEEGFLDQNKIVFQHGYSQRSKYCQNYDFVDEDHFFKLINSSEIIISHGGTSSIITALKAGKKVIIIPRKAKYLEHVDDHQMEICGVFKEAEYIELVEEVKDLKNAITVARYKHYKNYTSKGDLAKYIVDEIIGEKNEKK